MKISATATQITNVEDMIVKKLVLLFITVFCMCYMVACGGETNDTANVGGNNEIVNDAADKPVVTEAPVVEPEVTPAPAEVTPEPTEEPTPEPTENPYPGIDFDSELPGLEWVESFTGIIEEPKFVVYSDITGRKEIIENDEIVFINPDEDIIAVFSPDGYLKVGDLVGIRISEFVNSDHVSGCLLDSEATREAKTKKAGVYVNCGGEEIVIKFTLKPQ